jgi:hypothetical protein
MAYDRECQRIGEQRAYYQRQRERELERNRERCRKYREHNREQVAEQKRCYQERNRDRIADYHRDYRERNRDYMARRQQRTCLRRKAIPAPRNETRWTPAEDAIATRNDISITEMCYMVGRSYGAVSARRQKLRRKQESGGRLMAFDRREYQRKWRERNRQHARRRDRDYYQRNRERIAEQTRDYDERNRDRITERQREYRERNRDYVTRRQQRERLRRKEIPAPRNGTCWTPAEDAIVGRDDISLTEMCYMTGRSYGAVSKRRELLRRKESEK